MQKDTWLKVGLLLALTSVSAAAQTLPSSERFATKEGVVRITLEGQIGSHQVTVTRALTQEALEETVCVKQGGANTYTCDVAHQLIDKQQAQCLRKSIAAELTAEEAQPPRTVPAPKSYFLRTCGIKP